MRESPSRPRIHYLCGSNSPSDNHTRYTRTYQNPGSHTIIVDTMIETIVEKSVEDLRQLKGITATYRMTNKPLPVRHSSYVSGVLRPLKARKTESSLLRIRQGAQRRAGASSDASDHNISDTDKICMQLFLDAQEYGRNLAALGVEAADIPTYRSLWQCVAPQERQTEIRF